MTGINDRREKPWRDEEERQLWEKAEPEAASPIDLDAAWQKVSVRLEADAPLRSPWKPLFFVFPLLSGLAVLIWFFLYDPRLYRTDRGETRVVHLPDHSVVHLGAETELRLEAGFGTDHRRLALNGEAFFEVQSGGSAFEVHFDAGKVRVLGTQFNVRSRDRGAEVQVTEGLVEVSAKVDGNAKAVRLKAGDYVAWQQGEAPDVALVRHKPGKPDWMEGRLSFDRVPLNQALAEIERRFDVHIQLERKSAASLLVSGMLDAPSASAALDALCRSMNLEYELRHDTLVVR